MAMGMSYQEYWYGDGELAVYYRKAEEHRQEKLNWQLHLQGMYIYEALCDASPIFNPFAKKGTKPVPYRLVPYGVEEPKVINKTEQTRKAMEVFSARVSKFNEKFREEAKDAGS